VSSDNCLRFWRFSRFDYNPKMPCFSQQARLALHSESELEVIDSIDHHYDELLSRRVAFIQYQLRDKMLDNDRAKANGEVLRQTLLHRAERLLISLGSMLIDRNAYGLALLIRGHMEATAVLGNFCHRIASLEAGHISFDTFQFDLAHAVLGARHEFFGQAAAPPSILTCVERADRFLVVYEGYDKNARIVADPYEWMSEFCHPNSLSHSAAIELDRERNGFVIRHDQELREIEESMIGYADISSSLFLRFFDAFRERCEGGVLNSFQR
jgi:hypothetical protein